MSREKFHVICLFNGSVSSNGRKKYSKVMETSSKKGALEDFSL